MCRNFIFNGKWTFLLICSFIFGSVLQLKGQDQSSKVDTFGLQGEFDIRKVSFLLPQALPKYKYFHSLSLFYVIVPKDWAHDIIQAPMINYSAKYTLPAGFNLQGSLATLFISNRINIGPFWNLAIDKFYGALGYQVVFNFGFLNGFGFHTVLTGWEQQPSISLGYFINKSTLVFRGDFYLTNALNLSYGGNVVSLSKSFLNGYSFSGSIEQRLWKSRVLSFGVKANYLRYHILAWPAFPVNSYRYWVPEFQFGLNF